MHCRTQAGLFSVVHITEDKSAHKRIQTSLHDKRVCNFGKFLFDGIVETAHYLLAIETVTITIEQSLAAAADVL